LGIPFFYIKSLYLNLLPKQKTKTSAFFKIEFDFFHSYVLIVKMSMFNDNSEVFYRSDLDKKNKADIRTLVLEKNARDKYDKKIQNRVVIFLFFCLIIGVALSLIK